MSTDLKVLLREAVDDAAPDLAGIGSRARRQGLAIRRGRQAAGLAAVLGAGALVLVVPQVVAGTVTSPPASSGTALPTSGPQGPLTGPGTVAALRDAVTAVAGAGSAAGFEAEDGDGQSFGELTWTPADGSGWFTVGLNVQPGFTAVADTFTCTRFDVGCTVRTLSDGARLKVYEARTRTADGTGRRLFVDLLRADGTRVAASVTNGRELPASRWDLTRAAPGLTVDQLRTVVEQPVWGERMPRSYDVAGRRLPGLHVIDPSPGSADSTGVEFGPAKGEGPSGQDAGGATADATAPTR